MSQKKNMLEAFKSAAGAPEGDEPSAGAQGPSVPSPEGFTGVREVPRSTSPLPSSTRSGADLPPLPTGTRPAFLGWVLALVLAFAGGLLIGRGSRGAVEAGEDTAARPEERAIEPATTTRPAGIVPRAQDPTPTRPALEPWEVAEAALLERENQYTVVVATYGGTMSDNAWATVYFLTEQGIPTPAPQLVRDDIVVFAGAAPAQADLDDLVRRIRDLEQRGRRVFADAYVIKIDRMLKR